MSYHRYYDKRFGDLYEFYVNDATGEFENAMRSMETPGVDPIYYGSIWEIPQPQRHAIENLIWNRPKPSQQ